MYSGDRFRLIMKPDYLNEWIPLTKLERFTMAAMQGVCSNSDSMAKIAKKHFKVVGPNVRPKTYFPEVRVLLALL